MVKVNLMTIYADSELVNVVQMCWLARPAPEIGRMCGSPVDAEVMFPSLVIPFYCLFSSTTLNRAVPSRTFLRPTFASDMGKCSRIGMT